MESGHVRAVKWKFSLVVNNDLAIYEKRESWHPKGIGKPNQSNRVVA